MSYFLIKIHDCLFKDLSKARRDNVRLTEYRTMVEEVLEVIPVKMYLMYH